MLIKNLEVCRRVSKTAEIKAGSGVFSSGELEMIKEISQKIDGGQTAVEYTHNLIDEWPGALLSFGIILSEDGERRLKTEAEVRKNMLKDGSIQFFGGKKRNAGELIKSIYKNRPKTLGLDSGCQQNGGRAK